MALNVNDPSPAPVQTPPATGDTGIQGPTSGLNSSQQNAWLLLQQLLMQYGFSGSDLTSLVNWAKGQIVAGNSSDLIQLELEQTPQFQKRFPAIKVLANEGIAITPAQYIANEQQYASLEQAAGLPPNFASYDQLIAANVSPSEYADRINNGYLAVARADPTVVKAFQDYYGVGSNKLAAYFLDPTKALPILKQQAVAAEIGGASAMSGFGEVQQTQAMRLAQMGVNFGQAQQGFQKLASENQLTQGQLPGQGMGAIDTTSLLNAQFGSDAQTQLELETRAAYEKGTTNKGVGVAQTQTGATGAGAVQR